VLVVIAIGGNALAPGGGMQGLEQQRAHVQIAARAVAEVARRHDVVVTHGNGPQVGMLALQSEALGPDGALPLDVLDAESEGLVGYLIDQELGNLLPDRDVATLLTQVEVDPDDPAFAAPTKPIGPVHPETRARALERALGQRMVRTGDGFRRVVPSPAPQAIHEIRTIRLLVQHGVVVVCAGGGGIPVVRSASGGLRGVEAVVDKDRSAALLATQLEADALLLLTDVAAVYADWPEPAREPIRRASPETLRALELDPGSMGPKVEAACAFADTGGIAGIGALGSALAILQGEAGTLVVADAAR
jgi:carbamate kinase